MVSANTVKVKYVGMGWGRTIMITKKNKRFTVCSAHGSEVSILRILAPRSSYGDDVHVQIRVRYGPHRMYGNRFMR